jgi:hypothetical protein
MIKDGVADDPNKVANTKSSFIRDLYFSLFKQELNFCISNAGVCNANFRLFLLAQPEFLDPGCYATYHGIPKSSFIVSAWGCHGCSL